jgi:biofilm protein TabA
MIFGNLQNLSQDRKTLAKPLVIGLEYLKSTDFAKLPLGRYEIDGDRIFAMVQEYQTSTRESRKAETHCKYIDIQYVYEGVETIGCGLTDMKNEIQEDLSVEKDAIFYSTVQNERDLVLTAGRYAIFFPSDIHRPCCNFENEHHVKKIVLKVAVDLL